MTKAFLRCGISNNLDGTKDDEVSDNLPSTDDDADELREDAVGLLFDDEGDDEGIQFEGF